jgi:acyl-CoA thioesterase-2
VVAQALTSAASVVPSHLLPTALQTNFVNPGDPDVPITYTTRIHKPGRALWVVDVEATQPSASGRGLLLRGTFTFHRQEPSQEFQDSMPVVPRPEELTEVEYVPPGTHGEVRRPFEFRYCDDAPISDLPAPPVQQVWMRARDPLPDDPCVHAAALAFATDLSLTRTAHMPLRAYGLRRLGASLDHSVWFHRTVRADAWLLFHQTSVVYTGSRALSVGAIFDEGGLRVATAVQEALIRVEN